MESKKKNSFGKENDFHTGKKTNPDFIFLQEARRFKGKNGSLIVDTLSPLKNHLNILGYEVNVQPYNPTGNSFRYITGWNNQYTFVKKENFYISKTSKEPTKRKNISGMNKEEILLLEEKIKDNNYGEFWERCISVTHLKSLKPHEKNEFILINVHLTPKIKPRLESPRIISDLIDKLLSENKKSKIVLAGDFNCIVKWRGNDQMLKMTEIKALRHASKKLKLPDGSSIDHSYIFFPTDLNSVVTRYCPILQYI